LELLSEMSAIPRALAGALVGDAVAMPVHWYYNREVLARDYGKIDGYLAPRSDHPDSILWRSSYVPLNERGNILHDQARFWGQRGVHYHQFLRAGENTLNYQLATELYLQVRRAGKYDADAWLDFYTDFMLTPGHHRDTYVEEYHREFFTNYAQGKKPRSCGVHDVHIGGLVPVAALFDALPADEAGLLDIVQEHVGLTHRDSGVLRAARVFAQILSDLRKGVPLREAILVRAPDWISAAKVAKWNREPDSVVIGQRLSPACYISDAFPAALYLAWKYADDFSAGICANAHLGGDNCHRAAVVGALLGQANGVSENWLNGLAARDTLKDDVGVQAVL
jgi:ADP-ribosyl-[dinitrogen reductase] hydrolase